MGAKALSEARSEPVSDSRRRAHPRADTQLQLSMRLHDGRTITSAEIRNISIGGVFVVSSELLAFGTEVELEFSLPTGKIRCQGLVVWTTKTQAGPVPGQTGMGLRLMNIGVQEMRTVGAFVDQELKRMPAKKT
jgi:Tfp pilus assembly protein PilZ